MSSPWSASASARANVSQVPYTPGLDGLRAIAVVAVMVYHANHAWLSGGFLGVEVFFVISGYLITLLMIAEHERNGRVRLGQFWKRRFRRLLPALFVMMALLALYLAVAYRRPQGRTRGDFIAGVLYGSNWYQIVVGQSYTAAEAFAPLRHLWSLAVEEQFYLIWPLVMVLLLRRGREKLPRTGMWLFALSTAIAVAVGVLYVGGDVADTCDPDTTHGYARLFGRCINVNDALYLSTFTRAGGLMLGAGLAMLWRPGALMRGPLRDKSRWLDGAALLGLVGLGFLVFKVSIAESGERFGSHYDAWLYRGGLFLCGLVTVLAIAAVVHRRSILGKVLGFPVLNWIGTRSYGLYLYHWPIYQIIRKQAGIQMSWTQFAVAMAFTLPVTELSYRLIEMPIRTGRLGRWLRGEQRIRSGTAARTRRRALAIVATMSAAIGFAGVSLAVARNVCVGDVECSVEQSSSAEAAPPVAPVTFPATTAHTAPIRTTTTDAASDTDSSSGRPTDTTTGESTTGSSSTVDSPTTAAAPGTDATSSVGTESTAPPTAVTATVPVTTAPSTAPPISTVPLPPPSTAAVPPPPETDPATGETLTPYETVPPSPMSIPGGDIQPVALGESVMLGAITNLQQAGFYVDALKGRQGDDMAALVESLRANNQIGRIAVIQIGTNGLITDDDLRRIMAQLPPELTPTVVFLTVHVPKRWQDENNLRILALPSQYRNVTVVDWFTLSAGTSLCSDGTHIACGGGAAQYYSNLIFDAIGHPELKR